jgi:sec-independent protein translocase protein TatB
MRDSGAVLALLDTLTFPETLTILVLALVILGPEKLPTAARTIGLWISKAKSAASSLQSEMRDVMDDPQMQQLREFGEFAAQPRRKIAEYVRSVGEDDSEFPVLSRRLPKAGDQVPPVPPPLPRRES